jgi:hypothetical protein
MRQVCRFLEVGRRVQRWHLCGNVTETVDRRRDLDRQNE